jgi:cell division protein FtsL
MNTAGRLFNQGVLSRSWVISVLLSRTQFMTIALVLAILTSALSIIYVTNASRSLNATLQQTVAERGQLHIQWGQLLLEKSTWVTQARVQRIAEHGLQMVTPDRKSVVMINE